MGRKKLLRKLGEFFNMDQRDRTRRKEELQDLLSRLKQKESELNQQLELARNEEERIKLRAKIDLVHSKRKKGIKLLKEMNQPE